MLLAEQEPFSMAGTPHLDGPGAVLQLTIQQYFTECIHVFPVGRRLLDSSLQGPWPCNLLLNLDLFASNKTLHRMQVPAWRDLNNFALTWWGPVPNWSMPRH